MTDPTEMRHKLRKFGQEHLLAFWDELDTPKSDALLEQLGDEALDVKRVGPPPEHDGEPREDGCRRRTT